MQPPIYEVVYPLEGIAVRGLNYDAEVSLNTNHEVWLSPPLDAQRFKECHQLIDIQDGEQV